MSNVKNLLYNEELDAVVFIDFGFCKFRDLDGISDEEWLVLVEKDMGDLRHVHLAMGHRSAAVVSMVDEGKDDVSQG